MYSYALLYFEINLIAVFLVTLILIKTAGISRMNAQRNFSLAVYSEMAFCISDTLFVMQLRGIMPYSKVILLGSKSVYFLATTLMCFFWFLYFERLQESTLTASRRRVWAASVPVWGMVALLIVNPFYHCLFYVGGAGVYHRGSLFLSHYLLSYTYVLFTCLRALMRALRTKDQEKRRRYLTLAAFPVLPMIAGILQVIHTQMPLSGIAMAFATLIMYLNSTEEMISIDPLTRLNNRKHFFQNAQQKLHGGSGKLSCYLVIMDLDRFKTINDTYGHIEGDAALLLVADGLRASCQGYLHSLNLARLSGDEFILMAEAETTEEIETLLYQINQNLAQLCVFHRKPYQLHLSMGMARAWQGASLKELINRADAKLYDDKKRHRRKAI